MFIPSFDNTERKGGRTRTSKGNGRDNQRNEKKGMAMMSVRGERMDPELCRSPDNQGWKWYDLLNIARNGRREEGRRKKDGFSGSVEATRA